MNRFFTQLPVVIASLSLALIKAITDQLKWLGSFYYHIETAILGTLADISLAILSFRYVFLLLVIGGGLAYVEWWWALAGYVLIILIAVVRMVQLGTQPPTPEEEQAHQELRNNSIKFLRLPLRILAMLVSLYFSWQFVDWQGGEIIKDKIAEIQKALPSDDKKLEEAKVEESVNPELPVNETEWQKVGQKTCEIAWNNKDFKDGWCSLGEFPAGKYRFKPTSSLKMGSTDGTETLIPAEGVSVEIWGKPADDGFRKFFKQSSPTVNNDRVGLVIFKVDNQHPSAVWEVSLSQTGKIYTSINFQLRKEDWEVQGFYGEIYVEIYRKK
jgi:hypothetical protein